MELYVGNLNYTMTGADLDRLFSPYGEVVSARIVTDHFTRQSKCFGYVQMPHPSEGCQALDALDGKVVDQRELVVKEARSREDRQGQGW